MTASSKTTEILQLANQGDLISSLNDLNIQKPIFGPLHIYFGSQTGTSLNFAKALCQEARKIGFESKIIDLVDFNADFFEDVQLAVFILSTWGEGEAAENAKHFDEYISSDDRKGDEFEVLRYTVFGVGHSAFGDLFCMQGKRANKMMEKNGAERVYKYGEADGAHDQEADFNEWKKGLWPALIKSVQLENNITDLAEDGIYYYSPHRYSIDNHAHNLPFCVKYNNQLEELDFDNYDPKKDDRVYEFQAKRYLASKSANITNIKELRQRTDDGSTLHFEIDTKSAGLNYKTAENAVIYAENDAAIVDKVASLLGYNTKDIFVVEQNYSYKDVNDFKLPIPSPITIETYLTKFCDLQSSLRKKQLKDLAFFCVDDESKRKLQYIASPEGSEEYKSHMQANMLGLADVIEEFGLQIDLDQLIHIANPIVPRLYTIASSSVKHPDSMHVCISIHKDELPNGKKKMGLTSGFILRKNEEFKQGKKLGKVRVGVSHSTFILPKDNKTPIIMVGPGTGIAPFKAFIDEKQHLVDSNQENPYGEMTLFFGCKADNWDYIYRDELNSHHKNEVVKDLHVAFSRKREQRVYVQDLILQNKQEILELLLEKGAVLYICGSMSMGETVLNNLMEMFSEHLKVDAKGGKNKLGELKWNKKIVKELWG